VPLKRRAAAPVKRRASARLEEGAGAVGASKKKLRFDCDTKAYDGLVLDAQAFDMLVMKYCGGESVITTVHDVIRAVKECVPMPVCENEMFCVVCVLYTAVCGVYRFVLLYLFLLPSMQDENRVHAAMLGILARVKDLHARLLNPRLKITEVEFVKVEVGVDVDCVPDISAVVSSVPILPHGGGSCCKLPLCAVPDIHTLLQLVADAVTLTEIAVCSSKEIEHVLHLCSVQWNRIKH